ncbi:MAG TPA: trypsin-like peptidase domain-containing protein, partial [Anaerolineae bacterium]|nr:trypsin-like peptidase domain-containing protein [Anaerolineae bacterium]
QSNPWRLRWQHFRLRLRRALPFASGVLAALFALLLYNALVPAPRPLTVREVNDTVAQALASATPPPAYSAQVYQIIRPSLVLIQTESPGENGKTKHGLGSGVVVNDSGAILTSLHVVTGAHTIQVTYADGTESDAQILVKKPEDDIAIVQTEQLPQLLVPATLGNPGAMQVGDEAYAVGNPFGLYSSMSAGVISGFDRSFKPISSTLELHGLIQIDAAVNPGNSGGPLLNRDGVVIGVVTGIVNPAEEDFFVGIGFAVPINIALGGGGGSLPY